MNIILEKAREFTKNDYILLINGSLKIRSIIRVTFKDDPDFNYVFCCNYFSNGQRKVFQCHPDQLFYKFVPVKRKYIMTKLIDDKTILGFCLKTKKTETIKIGGVTDFFISIKNQYPNSYPVIKLLTFPSGITINQPFPFESLVIKIIHSSFSNLLYNLIIQNQNLTLTNNHLSSIPVYSQ